MSTVDLSKVEVTSPSRIERMVSNRTIKAIKDRAGDVGYTRGRATIFDVQDMVGNSRDCLIDQLYADGHCIDIPRVILNSVSIIRLVTY